MRMLISESALKLWIRSSGWRNARYLREPGIYFFYVMHMLETDKY
jgi:hypothetical protein